MNVAPAERLRLKALVFDNFRDWAGVERGLRAKHMTLDRSSFDRFVASKTNSIRTLRTIALLLSTTPEGLVSQVRLLGTGLGKSKAPKVKPLKDREAFQVAYQLWVEMTTRKLGIPIDPGTDLITECYDSWYAFFKVARELIKAIPLHKDPSSAELRHLIQLSHAVLNDGLRPHLQAWQARFRRWARGAGDPADSGQTPQQQQQKFPEWKALESDLLATNQRLISYVTALEIMVGRPNAPLARGASTRKITTKKRAA